MNLSALSTGLMVSALLLFSGCSINSIANSNISVDGNEEKATVNKSVKIADFNEIEASQAIKVIYVQGKNNHIANISTTPSAAKYLKVEVKNKTLKAYYADAEGKHNVKIKGPTIIRVSSPVLNEVELSSAANCTVEGGLELKGNFEIDLSSAAQFEAEKISCPNIDVDLSSSASVYIGSLTGNLETDLSSASSLKVSNMKGNLNAEVSSAASLMISSIKTSSISAQASSASSINIDGISGGNISASASSGAKVRLSGKAESLKKNSSSGGSVHSSSLSLKY